MDRLRKARIPIRSKLTKLVNQTVPILEGENPDKKALYIKLSALEPLWIALQEADKKVLDQMLDDDAIEEAIETEYDECTAYEESYLSLKIDLMKILEPPLVLARTEYEDAASSGNERHRKKSFKLPKIQLMQFDGKLKNWLSWWSQFRKIHEDADMDESDKFQYLLNAMENGTEAKDIVASYPQSSENYIQAVEALQERYGRDDLQLQYYVRELLTLVVTNVSKKEKLPLSSLYLRLESHLRCLSTLKLDKADPATWLFPLVESSLSEETLRAWQRSAISKIDGTLMTPPKTRLELLMDFIKGEVRTEQQIAMAQTAFQETSLEPTSKSSGRGKAVTVKKHEEVATAAGLISGEVSCGFCDGRHDSDRCIRAQTMDHDEKTEKLKTKGLCFRCLQKYHGKKKCGTMLKCILCGGHHQAIMCRGDKDNKTNDRFSSKNKSVPSSSTSENKRDSTGQPDDVTRTSSTANLCSSDVLLNILQVKVIGEKGTTTVRMVGDSGSQRSYIRQEVVRRVGMSKIGHEYIQNVLFGGGTTQPTYCGKYTVKMASLNGQNKEELELLERAQICGALPKIPNGPWISELQQQGIQLSDVGQGSSEIDILIGNDFWQNLLTGRRHVLSCGLVAVETSFGWTLSGRVPVVASNIAVSVTSSLLSTSVDVSQLWSLETLGISDPITVQSKEEEEALALSHFKENVTRDEDGRYIVALPWKGSHTLLPTNRMVAEKRLQRATHQLKKKDKFGAYDAVFRGWEQEGLIVRVDDDKESGHYLPHRPVFKDSTTTPVRPVFDASCKVGKHPSLNDCLYKGPNLLELIPSLLLRFREKAVGVSADIRKAFQMIRVREDDQIFQKFLWWTDVSCNEVKVFQHQRVVFGMNCSPFLLAATIYHHLQTIPDGHLVKNMIQSFYVDNLVTSVSTDHEYDELRQKASRTMIEAGMDLRQWARTIHEDSSEVEETDEKLSVLGLTWDRKNDSLACVIPEADLEVPYTKKMVLSLVARIFDPVGVLAPALVPLKNLIQESWAAEYGWDEVLPEAYQKRINKWIRSLTSLREIQLPRRCQFSIETEREIHVFVDASSTAYAAVIFLRATFAGAVSLQFLLAKSRLAPTKKDSKKDKVSSKPTIPRLELMSCVIGSRLATTVQKALDCKDVPFIFWSDSTTALAWIRRHDHWGSFVGNRVSEILHNTSFTQWRHVPGSLNPADLPSRGCDPNELLRSKWWEGPKWLLEEKSTWPNVEENVDEEAVHEEKRKTQILLAPTAQPLTFSSYLKNVAVYGWILRFLNAVKKTDPDVTGGKQVTRDVNPHLTITELRIAEKCLIKRVQKESFHNESDILKKFQTFMDEDGILRVKTRLINREDNDDFISPILLPKNHPITHTLIRDFHRFYGHGGLNFIREKLREKYWIINSRRTVRQVIGDCVICKRHSVLPLDVEPAPLPKKRISTCDPFTTTGVDLAGPLFLKKEKAWIVVYTCAVYRCIHLDIVTSLSTEAFLGSLERFIATFGRPNTIFSDNGTNFVGAANLFRQVKWKEVEEQCHVKQIQWVFNPPTAAWWGGFWERLIRSVKDLLKRMLGRSKLTYDQMRTCLAGVAATINDRPLTVVTEANGDLHAISPAMFIRPLKIGQFPDVERERGLPERYQKMKEILRLLQERFRKEYLSLLIMPPDKSKKSNPAVGDVVLVGAENKRRFEWPLGIIQELFPGGDGKIRVAKVKTATGILNRPLQRLYPLEVTRAEIFEETTSSIESNEVAVVDPEPKIIRTRRGRIVKKPTSYGQWIHLVK